MNIKYLLPFVALSTLGGCATSLSYDDASSFERSLLARESNLPKAQEYLYTQPVNKKESCKLPTSQDQLNRSNFVLIGMENARMALLLGLVGTLPSPIHTILMKLLFITEAETIGHNHALPMIM